MYWRNRWIGLVALVVVVVLSGCRQMVYWKSDPAMQSVSNEYFEANIIPKNIYPPGPLEEGFNAFQFNIKNKTDKNIELNWIKTLYTHQGQTSGGFMMEGILYKDRNDYWKTPDILFPRIKFSKVILPSVLVEGNLHNPMQAGENGIYLSVIVDGKEVNEKLSVILVPEEPKKLNPLLTPFIKH